MNIHELMERVKAGAGINNLKVIDSDINNKEFSKMLEESTFMTLFDKPANTHNPIKADGKCITISDL